MEIKKKFWISEFNFFWTFARMDFWKNWFKKPFCPRGVRWKAFLPRPFPSSQKFKLTGPSLFLLGTFYLFSNPSLSPFIFSKRTEQNGSIDGVRGMGWGVAGGEVDGNNPGLTPQGKITITPKTHPPAPQQPAQSHTQKFPKTLTLVPKNPPLSPTQHKDKGKARLGLTTSVRDPKASSSRNSSGWENWESPVQPSQQDTPQVLINARESGINKIRVSSIWFSYAQSIL